MRPAEIALCCLTLTASAILLAGISVPVSAAAVFLVLLCLVTIFHVVYEGHHWQLLPIYLAVLLAEGVFVIFTIFALGIVSASVDVAHQPPGRLIFGGIILVLTLLSLPLTWLMPMFRLPKPSGACAVGTRLLHMVDANRDAQGGPSGRSQRELMVQIWYPAEPVKAKREVYRRLLETTLKSSHHAVLRTQSLREAPVLAADAPYPLLIFNPAWTGQRTQSTFLMQELASHGFIVTSIDHTYYSGLVAFPDGRVIDSHMAPALGDFTHLTIAEGIDLANQFVTILAEDVLFVVDELTRLNEKPEGEWSGKIDSVRIGALGHSIGGAAAAEACWLDPRIKAALNLDGWSFGEVLRNGLSRPWMVVYGKGIEVEPANLHGEPAGIQRYWQMNRENYAIVSDGLAGCGGYCVTIQGASHWNFSDRSLYSPLRSKTQAGTIDPRRAHRIISEVAIAFFRESFSGAKAGLVAEAVRSYPEVEIKAAG